VQNSVDQSTALIAKALSTASESWLPDPGEIFAADMENDRRIGRNGCRDKQRETGAENDKEWSPHL